MPTVKTPTPSNSPLYYLSPDALSEASPATQARYAFADWLAASHANNPAINLRRQLLSYLRFIGAVAPNARWNDQTRLTVIELFGLTTSLWLRNSGTVLRHEVIHRLKKTRDPQPIAPKRIDTQGIYQPVDDDADYQGLLRIAEHDRRQRFAQYLESRRGLCVPRRAYRKWRGFKKEVPWSPVPIGDGLRKRQRVNEEEVRYYLGPVAANYVLSSQLVDRQDLAKRIREL